MPPMLRRSVIASAGVLFAGGGLPWRVALAQDADNRITLNHYAAIRLDDAEGVLDPHIRMRLLLGDREVPAEALLGVAFPPVRGMATHGDIRGLLVEFDPKDLTMAQVTNLAKPDSPGQFLQTDTVSDSKGLWRKLKLEPNHMSGQFVLNGGDAVFDFDTPVLIDPVVSTLTGGAAKSSAFVGLLRTRAQALGKGDMAAVRAISSRYSSAQDDAMRPPADSPQFKARMAGYVKALDQVSRVVVRGKTAVVLLPGGGFAQFLKEGADWKIAD